MTALALVAGFLAAGFLTTGLPASAATAGSLAGAAGKAASLAVKIVDLPRGLNGSAAIKGPDGYKRDVKSSVTLSGLKPGTYAVSAASVSAGGTTYVPSVTGASVTLRAGQSATSTVAYYTRIPTTTRAVAASDVASVKGTASGTQTVVVTGVAAVKAGQIIATGTGPTTPDGLLVKVTAVRASGTRQTLTTVPATLEQAIPQGTFAAASSLEQTAAASGLAPDSQVLGCGAGASITAGWGLDGSVTTSFTASWSLAGITATASATASEESEVDATATAGASCTLGPLPVGPVKRFAPIVRLIGYVPIVIIPSVQAMLKGSVSVSGAVSASAGQKFTATAGLSYDDGTVSAIHDVSNVTSYTAPTAGATASVDVTVGPQVTLSLYGLAGPVLNIDPGLNLTYNSAANPPWTLDAVLRAGATLIVPKLRINASDPDVIDLSYPLASGGTPKANWGDAKVLAGDGAIIGAISCPAPGDCSAGGSTATGGFLINETDGTWGKPQLLDISGVTSLSCVSAGNCVAGGIDSFSNAFLAIEVDGFWGTPQAIPGLAALGQSSAVAAVSCAPMGSSTFCAAGGNYHDADNEQQAFVVDASGDKWGNAVEFPGTAALNQGGLASVNSVSCVPAGKSAVDCAAGGDFVASAASGGTIYATGFVADETGGRWEQALPLNVDIVSSVSCASAGNCTAVGGYNESTGTEQAFGITESDGTWGVPEGITSPFTSGALYGVSCASPGNCAAAGTFDVSQVKGAWGKGMKLTSTSSATPTGQMNGVSCTTRNYCVAFGGNYAGPSFGKNYNPVAYAAADTDGTWTYATAVPGSGKAQGYIAACAPAGGYCLVSGDGDLAATGNVFVSSDTSTTATVKLSAGTVRAGRETSEKITVTITAKSGAEPAGTVIVSVGGIFSCTVILKDGTGSCSLAAKSLPPGIFAAIAAYYGAPGFDGSTSKPASLTVTG